MSKSSRAGHLPVLLIVVGGLMCGNTTLLAKVVVFWQQGFPTVASRPIARNALTQALNGQAPVFAGVDALREPSTLTGADLLVLPYGSAFPADDWAVIQNYLQRGGNLLILGGQPFRVPVTMKDGVFQADRPQDTYSRALGFPHTYEVPMKAGAKFAWKDGYTLLHGASLHANRFFAVEGHLDGLGYMVDADGNRVAAPVIVADRTHPSNTGAVIIGSRMVMLDFDPEAGYWESTDGVALVRTAAEYARQGAVHFWTETLFSAVKPDEPVSIFIHLRNAGSAATQTGSVTVEISSGSNVISTLHVACTGNSVDAEVPFHRALPAGFYTVSATYQYGDKAREFYRNGFWVSDGKSLASGPTLGVRGNFLTLNGTSYFPVGTNYFTTEEDGWDFSGPRNAAVWDEDFADMERHSVTFVRTGVWMPNGKFIDHATGGADERFLRNLEAYLLCAHRHNINVNFTFFAFSPHSGERRRRSTSTPNPYLDPASVQAEQSYILSVVRHFKDVPWLCWDLINEPSFSNPGKIFHGNIPNGDPDEVKAWQTWLQKRYGSLAALGSAWSVPPEQLGSFDRISLPSEADLKFARYGNTKQVRAFDYNLFAQDMFTRWVRTMVKAIRGTGSQQLVDVGQDEGGVTDRLLAQFYVQRGRLSFAVNHTYWQDDALLWDSVVAKPVGMPGIVGETGYQPVWAPDGKWRYDELTGAPLMERKWALGFAAGMSGFMQWDWAREPDFGMERSDGSAKIWESMMHGMGQFAKTAGPSATGLIQPQIALVLPQSLQLSVLNSTALEAQQNSVRALYQYARAEAYPVGEYQIGQLGSPKLIILPSAYVLAPEAWDAILKNVKEGATLLASGPFDQDAHFHSTGRQNSAGLPYNDVPLTIRDHSMASPGGVLTLAYGGNKTTILDRAVLPDGKQWAEIKVGKGTILFSPLPLELNDNLKAVGNVYRYAMRIAGVSPTYRTDIQDPGMLICPTQFPHATLYVLTSESNQRTISFVDQRSGKHFSGELAPGHAALLLIGDDGKQLAAYNWKDR
jgi:hypothetical protein